MNIAPAQKIAPRCRTAFTLIEIMVVVVIIVLMIGLALPVFRTLTGTRSEAGASNQITAVLGHARADAMGLYKTVGIATIFNSTTQKSFLAEVEFPDCQAWSSSSIYQPGVYVSYTATASNETYYFLSLPLSSNGGNIGQTPTAVPTYWAPVGGPPLDLRTDTDVIPLPSGIAVAAICNSGITGTGNPPQAGNRYLPVGVILFDGHGRLTSQPYGIAQAGRLGVAAGLTVGYPDPTVSPPIYYTYSVSGGITIYYYGVNSQFGIVVFQKDQYLGAFGQNPSFGTAAYASPNASQSTAYTTGSPNQQQADNWFDVNATPLLLNRYSGTLIKGE